MSQPANVCNVVDSGMSAFGLETLKADMAARCLDRPFSKSSIYELPFRTVDKAAIRWSANASVRKINAAIIAKDCIMCEARRS